MLRRRSGVPELLLFVLPVSIKLSSPRSLPTEIAPGNVKSTCGGSLTGSGGMKEAFVCDVCMGALVLVTSGSDVVRVVVVEPCDAATRSAAAILQTARKSLICCSSSL